MTWGSSVKSIAHFTNAISGQQESLFMKANYSSSHATINKGPEPGAGPVVANIDKEHFKMRREYRLTIPGGVDMALVVAMCVCLDDREESHSNAVVAGGGA